MGIGEKIRAAREDMDLTQSDIAKMIPMNQSNYSKIERDAQEPNIEQLRRICQILKINPSFLLGLSEQNYISQKDAALLYDVKQLLKKHCEEKR